MNKLTTERKEGYKGSRVAVYILLTVLTLLVMLMVYGAIDGVQYRGACGAAAVFFATLEVLVVVLRVNLLFKMEMEARFGYLAND